MFENGILAASPPNQITRASVDIRNLPPAKLDGGAADWFYRPVVFLHEFKSKKNQGLCNNKVIIKYKLLGLK